jgi:hypothetical protein
LAGFLNSSGIQGVRTKLTELSRFGMKYDDLLLKNSTAIGYIEQQMRRMGNLGGANEDLMSYSMALSDTTSSLRSKSIAFFQLDYVIKREKLREIASNGEIEFILETITDDAVVFDQDNRFCYPNDLVGEMRYKGKSKEERLKYQDKIINKYIDNFEKIYTAWGFNEGISAWQYFYQWLIEGHLAFEIIYDNPSNPREIIGFKELDPASLTPQVVKDASGKIYLEWMQKDQNGAKMRTMADSQIIYISYANHFKTKRISFVERLVRSFNLMRVIEHSKIIWHVMNAPIRLKTTVPIGTKSVAKSKEDIREFTNTLKEDIYFDGSSGELKVDGRPNILFYKNYVMPKNDRGEQIEIEALEYPGPNLSGSEMLRYFQEKLKIDSKIPYSRWDSGTGGGLFTLNAEGISREEIRYNKFISRLRAGYKELITKPLYLQMCLDFKELQSDFKFKNAIGIEWHNDNVFEEMKQADLTNKRLSTINSMKAVKGDDNQPFFSTDYLIKSVLKMSDAELAKNEDYKRNRKLPQADEAEEGEGPTLPEYEQGTAPAPPGPSAPETTPGQETGGSEAGGPGAL